VRPAAQYLYRLDAADTIVYVSPAWVTFAQENDAPELTAHAVVGKPLWYFISGNATRTLYVALFQALRAHRNEVTIPFNCDSPATARHMDLTLRPLRDGGIECEGTLLHQTPRPPADIFSRGATRSAESMPICSVCRRLQLGDEWLELAAALVRKPLFSMSPCPQLAETVCTECSALLAQFSALHQH
jgi:hypothetical protein